jgi:hypothetical protein
MTQPAGLEKLVKQTLKEHGAGFRPCAYFDDRLDCIRVVARDCSVYEERINGRVTVLMDNYFPGPGRRQYVGFTIKGARHFCKEHGWDLATSIKTTELIDALVNSCPEVVVLWFIDIVARPMIEQERIELVEIPDAAYSH